MRAKLALGAVVLALFIVSPAVALNNRSAVSVSGLDTNPCTTTSPCRSFGVALSATAIGGEVIALDSAGYGPFTVTQSVSVSGAPGIHAAVTATSGDAIDITGGGFVEVANLFVLGASSGAYGINNSGGLLLRITNCLIQGFSTGVLSSVSGGKAIVDHTTVENDSTGMEFDNTQGSVSDSAVSACSNGINVVSSSSSSDAHVTRTLFQFNNNYSVKASGIVAGQSAFATVDHCTSITSDLGIYAHGSPGNAYITLINSSLDSVVGDGTYTVYTTGNNFISLGGATLTPIGLN